MICNNFFHLNGGIVSKNILQYKFLLNDTIFNGHEYVFTGDFNKKRIYSIENFLEFGKSWYERNEQRSQKCI